MEHESVISTILSRLFPKSYPKHKTLIKTILFILFFAAFFIGTIWDASYRKKIENKVNNEYFEKFNDYFSGTITEVTEDDGTHVCIIYLHIDSSTTKLHDLRNIKKYYYCVIKNDSAEIIEHVIFQNNSYGQNWIEKGDRFIFNGKCDSAYLYHGDSLMRWQPRISTHSLITIQNKHRLSLTKP